MGVEEDGTQGVNHRCICEGCEEEADEDLDYYCEFCFAHCPHGTPRDDDAPMMPGVARSLVGLLRWRLHNWKAHLERGGHDALEGVRRILRGEKPYTTQMTEDEYTRMRFEAACDEEP